MEYSTYLQVLDKFHTVEKEKKGADHKKYVADLFEYLKGFYERTHPLADLDEVLSASIESFEEQWAAGTVLGYEEDKNLKSERIDLGVMFSPKHLEELGREPLKKELARLGLKQGGTLQQLAERLFATKGKDLGQLDKKMFSKATHYKEVAMLEMKCAKFVDVLRETIEATRLNIQKKQSRSQFENEQEMEEELDEEEEVVESDDEDKPFYNPLNLPLGWDGKPIPFWLYKLHGLGIEYKCEICGNYSFWGRRAFERHFQEWRHAHGMRCLKIPNSRHFHEITLIEDALSLWEKIKSNAGEYQWRPDAEEEFEDSQGNVLNRKTYDDLARQGLL
jgi:splicing factor 3A subunit 3